MEYHPGQVIVEPWNSLSSLLILIPAIYWILRFHREKKKSSLILMVVVLMIAGGLGSTLFHAFRVSLFFLYMDILPTAILTLILSFYFWLRVLKKWYYAILVFLPLFSSRFLFWNYLPEHTAINVSYFITGVSIGLPLIIYLFQTHFRGWQSIALTILFFAIALTFRQFDKVYFDFLPMGTHFLWHAFSALGAWFILKYLYSSNRLYKEGTQD